MKRFASAGTFAGAPPLPGFFTSFIALWPFDPSVAANPD
jgi:hypothetical protein